MSECRTCWLCGENGSVDHLDRHHIFGGPFRKKSEKYGLVVYLCHRECHIFGLQAAHNNAETMLKIKHRKIHRRVRKKLFVMKYGKKFPDTREFMK